ncbi:hypothetical protein [Kitasatospora sp. NBC_00070]|uniref:hypothetical protein n=1 Tax=Kitasatospora sp. NBC_00070 TaxID=2975962 RepID=UPI003860116F
MRSIGAMARQSGLSVSALRFYDGAGVFGPAWVDPQTGSAGTPRSSSGRPG